MFVNRTPQPRRHVRRAVALVSLLAFGAAACSDDPDDAATTTAAPTTAAPGDTTGGGTDTTVAGSTTTVPLPMGDIVATALTNHVFTELAGLVVDAGLVDALRGGPFTVFAPTDGAFDKIPADILHTIQDADADGDGVHEVLATVLTHHVVEGAISPDQLAEGELTTLAGTTLAVTKVGDQFFVDGNPVGAGVEATNGWVYVMSDVLVPAIGDIVDIATTLPGFATLVDLVSQAGLVEALKGEGPLTVFAPIDAAFEAVPSSTLNSLVGQYGLENILLYHVVSGKITTDQLTDGQTLETLAGLTLTVSVAEDGTISINGVPIAVQNVQASNGVIQVMGGVLVPEG